jgi:hypothetical protein
MAPLFPQGLGCGVLGYFTPRAAFLTRASPIGALRRLHFHPNLSNDSVWPDEESDAVCRRILNP